MPAKPTNADLQRQIYSLQTELRTGTTEIKASMKGMSDKLDKALEHSAAHKARLDAHEKAIEGQGVEIATEREAREGMGWWMVGVFITAILGLGTAALGLLTGHRGA